VEQYDPAVDFAVFSSKNKSQGGLLNMRQKMNQDPVEENSSDEGDSSN